MKRICLVVLMLVPLGCATVRDKEATAAPAAGAATAVRAVADEGAAVTETDAGADSRPADERDAPGSQRGGRVAAVWKCGWQGARAGIETARFLSVFAIPLIAVTTTLGAAQGAFKGGCG